MLGQRRTHLVIGDVGELEPTVTSRVVIELEVLVEGVDFDRAVLPGRVDRVFRARSPHGGDVRRFAGEAVGAGELLNRRLVGDVCDPRPAGRRGLAAISAMSARKDRCE
jgi:hypothetical protein